MATTNYYERILQEDLNVGVSLTTKRNPGGGTLTATQIGIHTFALGQVATEASWTPGPVVLGTPVTTTVTVSGAVAGDFALVSFDAMQTGLRISADVTANNTVTVALSNMSNASITPASGTIRVLVFQSR